MGELRGNNDMIVMIIVYISFFIFIKILDLKNERKTKKQKTNITLEDEDDIFLCHCENNDLGTSISSDGVEYCLQCGLDLPKQSKKIRL